jgi:5-methylcytosine-specific restriction endonuclease McrA
MAGLSSLGTLVDAQKARRAQPKPATRLELAMGKQKQAEREMRLFKADIWFRDKSRCRICHCKVVKSLQLQPIRGEVHHIHPRSLAKTKRLDVNNAILVCALCHVKLTRHEITWKGTP